MFLNLRSSINAKKTAALMQRLADPDLLDWLAGQLQSRSASPVFDEHHCFTVKPKIGGEYVLYKAAGPVTIWVYLDLSAAQEGDKFVFSLYSRPSNRPQDSFKLHERYILEDRLTKPVITLSNRFAPACRLTLTQSRGISKEVTVEVFARLEGGLGDRPCVTEELVAN